MKIKILTHNKDKNDVLVDTVDTPNEMARVVEGLPKDNIINININIDDVMFTVLPTISFTDKIQEHFMGGLDIFITEAKEDEWHVSHGSFGLNLEDFIDNYKDVAPLATVEKTQVHCYIGGVLVQPLGVMDLVTIN